MKKCSISHLTFAFEKQQKPFFDDVSVSFESGSLYFIQGKNGVGKSTLFSILQGTTPAGAVLKGSINYNDAHHAIHNNIFPQQISTFVKTVIQDSGKMIASAMNVGQNLQLSQLSQYPLPVSLTQHVILPALMKECGISLETKVSHLSGGQKQILAIMMALQKPTNILLLDEPTAALDEKNSILVMNFLHNIAQKQDLIVVIITHDQDLITQYGSGKTLMITEHSTGARSIAII